MSWIFSSLQWYFYLLLLGLAFMPLARVIFPRFFDGGYAFAKTIGILCLSYIVFLSGILKILPFDRATILLFLALGALSSWYFFYFRKPKEERSPFPLNIIVFEEVLFFVAIMTWTFVRGQEPSIRGLEKFMDFGFMNSILRAKYFPPLDIWYSADPTHPAGYPINYYYFGHLVGAFLIRLSGIAPEIGYNLILSTICALGVTQSFSLIGNIIAYESFIEGTKKALDVVLRYSWKIVIMAGIGSFIVNFGGNLHTIYLFTSGYPNESPVPFWTILSGFNPTKYWYPNATRFIPFTIHEFPSYSYVVADLHGHVFDIPFVILTLAILFTFFITYSKKSLNIVKEKIPYYLSISLLVGFLTAVHYMTNAFDGPIYLLLSFLVFFVVLGATKEFLISAGTLIFSFGIFSLPFSHFFTPFVNGIGVNCSPDFLVKLQKVGPFLFEKGNCQMSYPWMLFVLWGFFWVNFILLLWLVYSQRERYRDYSDVRHTDLFALILFFFGTFLIIVPEFFYIKDIYPAHFRANTMFKLGYQAFIMMSVASAYVLYRIRTNTGWASLTARVIWSGLFVLIFLYPFFSVPSFYGNLQKEPVIDGSTWLKNTYPEDKEIVDYINTHIDGQPNILEAQGDSYTDFERISAYTGLPTVAGWWVHEWLWRGSSDIVGKRIPDVVNMYESNDLAHTKDLLKKYNVSYVIVASQERTKYKNLNEKKFSQLGKKIFEAKSGSGALYQLNP